MALAYRIRSSDEFGRLFAAHDQFSALVNETFGRVLTSDDDYFTAPFCFIPSSDLGGYFVMTCLVPWLHGNYVTEQHFQAALEMLQSMVENPDYIPILEPSMERVQQECHDVREKDIYCFTTDGCYPSKDEITPSLEDRAVEVTCEAMGWEVPDDWRQMREMERSNMWILELHGLGGPDKPREGSGNKRMKYSPGPYQALIVASEQEEKKESFRERHDVDGASSEQRTVHEQYSAISRSEDRNETMEEYYGHYGAQTGYSFESGDTHGDSFYDEDDELCESLDDSDDLYGDGPSPNIQHLRENFQEQRLESFHSGDPNVVIDENDEGSTVVHI